MKALTKNLLQQRVKHCTTDLDKIKQINVAGRKLNDVTLLKELTGVEVLSLSVNQISGLADFENCKNLKKLYLRNNNITSLKEIYYLKNLPQLELLVMSENPCAEDPSYRMTIIKNIKTLEELDGIPITQDERKTAEKLGQEIFLDADSNIITKNSAFETVQTQKTPEKPPPKPKPENPPEVLVNITPKKSEEIQLEVKAPNTAVKKPVKSKNIEKILDQPRNLPMQDEIQPRPSVNQNNLHSWNECMPPSMDTTESARTNLRTAVVLSTILNLVKELDYQSLQVIDAELNSLLNILKVNYLVKSNLNSEPKQ